MCSNYVPVTRMDRLLRFFGVQRDRDEAPLDVFPTGLAPFIRRAEVDPEAGQATDIIRTVADGAFGLLPFFAKELAYGRRTYNARSETVASLPSFRNAWRRGQRCIVPAEAIYEPNWETGRAVRWRIGQHGDVPIGIAGVYEAWRHPDGHLLFSFAMLTVNADEHPLMKRFHREGEEKRMVAILDPADFDAWLACAIAQAPGFLRQWSGELVAMPAPLLRPPKAADIKPLHPSGKPDDAPRTGSLF